MNSATTTVKWTLNRMDDLPPMAPREGKSITGPLQDDENRLVVRVVPNGLPECAVVQEFRTPPFDGQYYFGVTDGSGSCGGSPVLVLEMKTGRRIG